MTRTNLLDNRAVGGVSTQNDTGPLSATVAWVGAELFGLMAAAWPVSASQLNNNARGAVDMWCAAIRGFTAKQVIEVVNVMAMDPDRQFAPRPAEVRAALLAAFPRPVEAPKETLAKRVISIAAIRMGAEATIYTRAVAKLMAEGVDDYRAKASAMVTPEKVAAMVERSRAKLEADGVIITGKI